jgi:hypothetical protein
VSRAVVIVLLVVAGCAGASSNPLFDEGVDGAMHDAMPVMIDAALLRDGASFDAAMADLAPSLLALTTSCTVASNSKYAPTSGAPATIDICALNGAYFWKADMDIDCDGQMTSVCNVGADPYYQDQTSFNQSDGHPLIASVLPYVVLPIASSRFSFSTANIKPGAVVAVMYEGKLTFGVFGDEGPSSIIGEASYAMAQSLGIDPNPSTGGVGSGVTYIAFVGSSAVVSPIEDHAAATTLGESLSATLLQNN